MREIGERGFEAGETAQKFREGKTEDLVPGQLQNTPQVTLASHWCPHHSRAELSCRGSPGPVGLIALW